MLINAGLGNPGKEYENTRHNAGFMVMDALAEKIGADISEKKHKALCGKGVIGGEKVILMKPQTYMNLSGEAVAPLARFYKVPAEDVIVIYDDMDLPTGKLRLRMKGGSGGHRGIESLLYHLRQDTFNRVRLGIGRPPVGWAVPDYVLSRFHQEEQEDLNSALEKAADAVEGILKLGMSNAMNRFNR